MYNLILQLTLMASLGVIVYIVALTIPRVEGPHAIESKVKKAFSNIPLNKIDDFIIFYKDKMLRKIRLLTMKLDNLISKSLDKDKEE